MLAEDLLAELAGDFFSASIPKRDALFVIDEVHPLPAVPTAQFDRFPDRQSFSAAALRNIAPVSKGMSHAKKAWRMSFVFTTANRSQFNLVRPDAVGFQPGTHANSFSRPTQVWQMNSGT